MTEEVEHAENHRLMSREDIESIDYRAQWVAKNLPSALAWVVLDDAAKELKTTLDAVTALREAASKETIKEWDDAGTDKATILGVAVRRKRDIYARPGYQPDATDLEKRDSMQHLVYAMRDNGLADLVTPEGVHPMTLKGLVGKAEDASRAMKFDLPPAVLAALHISDKTTLTGRRPSA